MPNRIIRESCRTSPTLMLLSDGAERLFWRLTTVADDFGRFEADPDVLRAQCFPRAKEMTFRVKTIAAWFEELRACCLVTTYVVNGHQLGFFNTWDKHQRTRAKESKYPAPSSDNMCQQTTANVAESSSSESRVVTTGNEESGKSNVVVPNTDDSFAASLKSNPAYLGIDVDRETGKCRTWCETNGKVFSRRRLVNWLNRVERPMNGNGNPGVGRKYSNDLWAGRQGGEVKL